MAAWLVALPTLAAILILSLWFYKRTNTTKKLPPAAAGGWPLIGHLFLLSGPQPLHTTLSKLSDKYGPIFSVRLGSRYGVIVNSSELAKECCRTNDVAFSNRPQTGAVGLMGYNFALFGFSKYGPYWREMRKIAVLRLLSSKKVEALGDVRELEIRSVMRSMYETTMKVHTTTIDMQKVFGDMMLSLMIKMVAGDVEMKMDSREKEEFREHIREFLKMMSVSTISDVFPSLKWIDKFGRMHKAFRKAGQDFDNMMQTWLNEQKKNTSDGDKHKDQLTFMSEMLSVAESVAQQFPYYDADTINKATCLNLMIGGTDTIGVALTWALCLLLNNRQTLKKAQEELDTHVGRERQVKESDLVNLEYIKAVIKESMRIQPPGPLVVRMAGEDCVVAGYHVPAGTSLFINVAKIQSDPRVWVDPSEFKPERFLTTHKEVDVQGVHFELMPFGGGRRICPAVSFSLSMAELTLASFLHGFDVETPSNEAVDMKGSFGTSNTKATPLEVYLTPRLSPHLYA